MTPVPDPTPTLGGTWLLLHEAPYDGQWIGLSEDWVDLLPCSKDVLASWLPEARIKVMLDSPLGQAVNRAWRQHVGLADEQIPHA